MAYGTTYYRPGDHTAAEWREQAAASRQRAADSWARSDTDGFLTQMAGQQMARLYDALAASAERGGVEAFAGLYDLRRDRLLSEREARYVETRYGPAWAVNVDGEPTVWFRESSARSPERRRANDAKKGFRLVSVDRPAIYRMGNHGPVAEPVRGSDAVGAPDQDAWYREEQ